MSKKIGILTSGGDAPGMNAAIRAITLAGLRNGYEVVGIYDGYKGILEENFTELTAESVFGIFSKGGTILGTARLPDFKEPDIQKQAAEILKKHGIEALCVIGGDGTYMGAQALYNHGINCIGLPGTIDNDISSTDYTIGFDTAMNTINWSMDHIRDTTLSHQRCAIVEIMGNHCPDLTLMSGIAEGADIIVTPTHKLTYKQIIKKLNNLAEKQHRRFAIVLVAEKMPEVNVDDLKKMVSAMTPFEAKSEVLGRIQRGGAPSSFDRLLASSMGAYAVQQIAAGKGGIVVSWHHNHLSTLPIMEALSLPQDPHKELLEVANTLML